MVEVRVDGDGVIGTEIWVEEHNYVVELSYGTGTGRLGETRGYGV